VNCPRPECDGKVRVTHTFGFPGGYAQRVFCDKCKTVGAVQATLVAVNPARGDGAAGIARRMKRAAGERGAAGPERDVPRGLNA